MSFRDWTKRLRQIQGNQPQWPWLLAMMLDEEFKQTCVVDDIYKGDVFIDRDEHQYQEGQTERCLVPMLYHHCLQKNNGCLQIDEETIWLLGYEWPNQGGNDEKGRRADLVGMRKDGSLVVFECKRENNDDPPLTALIEGLDYLACLYRSGNFDKIEEGFQRWISEPEKGVPEGFEDVQPKRNARPCLTVLAPEKYFKGRYARSHRGDGWAGISEIGDEFCESFSVQFVASEFDSHMAKLL